VLNDDARRRFAGMVGAPNTIDRRTCLGQLLSGALLPFLAGSCTGAAGPGATPAAAPRGSNGLQLGSDENMTHHPPAADRTFSNPILPGFHPDPSICRVGSDYYLATSSFEYFPGVPIFHSRDLVHWRQIGHALTRRSQLPLANAKSSQGIFAPSLRHHAGTFYMVTTNVSDGGNFFVTASDPAGEWSEPIWLKEPVFGIDPSLSFASNGRVYYTREGGGERGAIYQTELDLKTGRLLGEPRAIWAGTGGIWPEGPHLYEIEGRYYLLIAEGGTSTGHCITVARSNDPFGPFEPCPHNPILTHSNRPQHPIQATGHGDLVQTVDGRWWIVLLGIRRWDGKNHHLGRETFLAPVTWSEGWPIINGGSPIELTMSSEGLPPPHPWPSPSQRDDFDSRSLGLDWNFVRNPAADSWSLAARPGFLRLSGSDASLEARVAPAFVGRRQRHFRVGVRARLEFSPRSSDDFAGLALRANEDNHYALSLTGAAGERRVQLVTRVQGRSTAVAEERVPDGPIELSVEAFADRYELAGGPPGALRPLGSAPTAPLSTEAAGGFTGVYFGMFAITTGPAPMPPADFDWFEYSPRDSA
jgi:xylan 1,4-beta-xylosidase